MTKYTEIEEIDASTYAGKAALACRKKARGIFGDELLTFTLIDFVSLMLLNNKFIEKGIVITDSNKEECYVKIIELGDDALIDDLERFINLKDQIQELEMKKQEYSTIIEMLQSLTDFNDEDAINSIIKNYLRK